MKNLFKKIISKFLKLLLYIFYKKEYINSEYYKDVDNIISATKYLWFSKILGFNRNIPFPVHYSIRISEYKNLIFDKEDIINFKSFGCYYQNFNAKIYIGKGTIIAPNVGMITSNHDFNSFNKHSEGKDIVIGKNCWIGMNSVILPGVSIANNTIIGAGSVVTKSFFEEKIIIAGNPAKKIKDF